MECALAYAIKAQKKDEVPVGAVIVYKDKIIATGYNKRENKQNALLHAEVVAINKACKKLKSWRLDECDMYVTLEPCPMCAGAIINSRIKNVYFGAYDPKSGACGSVVNLLENKTFNHNPNVVGGILEAECSTILTEFFKQKRENKKGG